MKNVVITGLGIKSCIGNEYNSVLKNLQEGKSGIIFNETYDEMNFRSCVSGSIKIDLSEYIDRKLLRFMGESAGYAYLATLDALKMAGVEWLKVVTLQEIEGQKELVLMVLPKVCRVQFQQ